MEYSPASPAPEPAPEGPELVDPMDAPLPPTLQPVAPDVVPSSLLDGALGEPAELPADPMDAPLPRAFMENASAHELREQIHEKRKTVAKALGEFIGPLDLKPLLDEDFEVEGGKYVGTYKVYLPVFNENGNKAWTLLPYPRIANSTFVFEDLEHPKLVAELRFLERVETQYLPLFVGAMAHYDPKTLTFDYDLQRLRADWELEKTIPVVTAP